MFDPSVESPDTYPAVAFDAGGSTMTVGRTLAATIVRLCWEWERAQGLPPLGGGRVYPVALRHVLAGLQKRVAKLDRLALEAVGKRQPVVVREVVETDPVAAPAAPNLLSFTADRV